MSSKDIYKVVITKISWQYELADLTATLGAGVITGVTIVDAGVGQTGTVTISVTGDGTGADLTPVLDDDGAITSVTINDGGSGYTTATLTVSATEPTGNVVLESSIDKGNTWVTEDTYAVTTTEQTIETEINKTVDGIRLTAPSPVDSRLSIFSMIAYADVDVYSDVIALPFVFNLDQKYVLALSYEQIAIYQDDALVATVPASGLDSSYFDKLKSTQAEDTMVLTHADMRTKQLQRRNDFEDTFTANATTDYISATNSALYDGIKVQLSTTATLPAGLSTGTDYYGVSDSGGNVKLSLTLGGTAIDITDAGTGTHTLEFQDVFWDFKDFPYINIPMDAFNNEVTTQPAVTLTPSATEGSIKLTAGGATFTSDSVGQLVDGNGGRVRITEYESTTIVYGYTIIPFYSTAAIASGDWDYISGYVDVWSATKGYPISCLFYEQRLWLGGSKSKPNTIWASRVGQMNDFENVANYANDSISATISSEQIDAIVNIYANRGIQVFTSGAEWIIPEGATTPDTINVTKNTSNGSIETVNPIDISGVTMFVEKNGKSLLSFVYSDVQAAYTTESLSLLTDLVQNPTSMTVDYNSSQDVGNFLYMSLADGTVAVWCIMLSQKIVSPVRWISANSGYVTNVINVAGDTYMLVVRGDYVYLEKVADIKTDFTTTDTGLSASISGLGDYEGNTVHAYTDTIDYGNYVVSNGEITLSGTPTETVYIGYDFDYALTSNKLSINGQTENIEKRISKATVVTKDTDKLIFENQTIEQTDDIYDVYSVTGFRRDCRFHITGEWNYTEIISILLNINYGEK